MISGDQVSRDLPAGSDVEVKVIIDGPGKAHAEAYVPLLNNKFEILTKYGTKTEDPDKLSSKFDQEKKRLDEFENQSSKMGDKKINEVLMRIKREHTVDDIERLLSASESGDKEATNQCQNRLRDLGELLDKIQDLLEWPMIVEQARKLYSTSIEIINQFGNEASSHGLAELWKEANRAIDSEDKYLLRSILERIEGLDRQVCANTREFWLMMFKSLIDQKPYMSDQSTAEKLIKQGILESKMGNIDGLREILIKLVALLPEEKKNEISGGFGSTMTK